MSNYYEDTLVLIKRLIDEGKDEEARNSLVVELSMPYIPEPYFMQFNELMASLSYSESTNMYYQDVDSIYEGLLGDDSSRAKAIASLERMNLRIIKDDIQVMLNDIGLDDLSKRYLLMLAMDQELDIEVDLVLDGKTLVGNSKHIENPFSNEIVLGVYNALVETYEAKNPSFLKFCLEELSHQLINSFPFVSNELSFDKIVSIVNSYFE